MSSTPIVEPSAAQLSAHVPDQPSDVLVADDDPILAECLDLHLKQLGFNVLGPVDNGQTAIKLAKQQRPDLVLMDIRMPGIDGLSAASILFKHMGIPVVLISAHCDPEYVEAGRRGGVFGYLVKPVTIDQLRVNVAVAWGKYCQHVNLYSQVQDLKNALEDRKFIERAKGLLMDRLGLGENEAMCRLKKHARDSRQRLSDLARVLVENKQLFDPEPKNSS